MGARLVVLIRYVTVLQLLALLLISVDLVQQERARQ